MCSCMRVCMCGELIIYYASLAFRYLKEAFKVSNH